MVGFITPHESFGDIVVGAPGMDEAFLYYSNAGDPGAPMPAYTETSWAGGDGAVFDVGPGTFLGRSVAASSDIDNDGVDDILFGAPGMMWFGVYLGATGSAHVFLGEDSITGSRYSNDPRL